MLRVLGPDFLPETEAYGGGQDSCTRKRAVLDANSVAGGRARKGGRAEAWRDGEGLLASLRGEQFASGETVEIIRSVLGIRVRGVRYASEQELLQRVQKRESVLDQHALCM